MKQNVNCDVFDGWIFVAVFVADNFPLLLSVSAVFRACFRELRRALSKFRANVSIQNPNKTTPLVPRCFSLLAVWREHSDARDRFAQCESATLPIAKTQRRDQSSPIVWRRVDLFQKLPSRQEVVSTLIEIRRNLFFFGSVVSICLCGRTGLVGASRTWLPAKFEDFLQKKVNNNMRDMCMRNSEKWKLFLNILQDTNPF